VTGMLLALPWAWTRQPSTGAGRRTISGKVKFTRRQARHAKIDMTEEPSARPSTRLPTDETVVVNANGTLANVFVYVKSVSRRATRHRHLPAGDLDQDGCRYHPTCSHPGRPDARDQEFRRHPAQHQGEGESQPPFNISQPA